MVFTARASGLVPRKLINDYHNSEHVFTPRGHTEPWRGGQRPVLAPFDAWMRTLPERGSVGTVALWTPGLRNTAPRVGAELVGNIEGKAY
jgi:hypothetical protein